MKAKETKKTIKKAVKAPQTVTVRKTEPKKIAKASDTKTSTEKKAVAVKAEVTAKPKAKISKVPPVKPKPVVKTAQKAPKKKAVAVKAEVKVTPKAKVSKVSAIRPKTSATIENKAPKKKTVTVKAKVKPKPKAVISKVPAVKPKPVVKTEIKKAPKPARTKPTRTVSKENKAVATKKEPAVHVKPSLKSVAAVRKYETREEPKPKAELYPVISSKARLKIFLPDQDLTEEKAEEIFFGGLPEEYGENSVIALAVDPNTVFVDWEVIPKDISDKDGDLNLRFYDITGIAFNDWNAHSVVDVLINKRVGSDFFEIRMPGRDVVVAVGILSPVSGFMPIMRSGAVSFPSLLSFDELGIVQKLFESGIPVGY